MDSVILIVIFLIAFIIILIVTNQDWYIILGVGALAGAFINSLLKTSQKKVDSNANSIKKSKSTLAIKSKPTLKSVDSDVDNNIKSMLKSKMQQNDKKYSKGAMVAILGRYNDDRRSIDEKMAAKCAEQATLDQRAIISNSKQTEASQRYIWEDELTAHENRVWWEQDDNFDLRM